GSMPVSPAKSSPGPGGARAPPGTAPAGPFALAGCGIEPRLEAAIEAPAPSEALRIRANACRVPGQIGRAERGRLHHHRTIDGGCENIGEELHCDIARGHATIDAQYSAHVFRHWPFGVHGAGQFGGL